MDIKIEERLVAQVTILDIVGKLTMDEAAQHLKDKINSLISQGRTSRSAIRSSTSGVNCPRFQNEKIRINGASNRLHRSIARCNRCSCSSRVRVFAPCVGPVAVSDSPSRSHL